MEVTNMETVIPNNCYITSKHPIELILVARKIGRAKLHGYTTN